MNNQRRMITIILAFLMLVVTNGYFILTSFFNIDINVLIDKDENKEKLSLGISSYKIVSEYDNKKREIIDFKNDYYVYKMEDEYYLANILGNTLLMSKKVIKIVLDEKTLNTYFLVTSNQDSYLYDSDINIVYKDFKITEFKTILDNVAYFTNYKIDLKENITKEIKVLKEGEDYLVYQEDEKVYAIYEKKKIGPYESLETLGNDIYYLHGNDDFFLEIGSFELLNDETLAIVNDHDFKIELNEDNRKRLIFENDKSIDIIDYKVRKDYIEIYDNNKTKIYNRNGNLVKSICDNIFCVNDDFYICYENDKAYLVDKMLDKKSNEYDDITCFSSGLCKLEKNGKYGLSRLNEVIVEPKFSAVYIDGDEVLISDLFSFLYLKMDNLKKGLNFIDIQEDLYEKEFDIDVLEVIEENDLNNIKDIISQNEVFFQKYAYVVNNNLGLDGYQNYFWNLFPIIINYKQYMDENFFLNSLNNLYFYESKSSDSSILASYLVNSNAIKVGQIKEEVIYHELIHFLDFSFNKSKMNNHLYLNNCKGSYYIESELEKLDYRKKDVCKEDKPLFLLFLTEAGAELYRLFNAEVHLPTTYFSITMIYSALKLIYEEEMVNRFFWKEEGAELFYQESLKIGYSPDEFLAMINLFNKQTNVDRYSKKDLIEIVNHLLTLYDLAHKDNWYNDIAFNLVISTMIYGQESNLKGSKYYAEIMENKINFEDFLNEQIGNNSNYFKNAIPSLAINVADDIVYMEFMSDYYVNDLYKGKKDFVVRYDIVSDKLLDD